MSEHIYAEYFVFGEHNNPDVRVCSLYTLLNRFVFHPRYRLSDFIRLPFIFIVVFRMLYWVDRIKRVGTRMYIIRCRHRRLLLMQRRRRSHLPCASVFCAKNFILVSFYLLLLPDRSNRSGEYVAAAVMMCVRTWGFASGVI